MVDFKLYLDVSLPRSTSDGPAREGEEDGKPYQEHVQNRDRILGDGDNREESWSEDQGQRVRPFGERFARRGGPARCQFWYSYPSFASDF